MTTAKPLEKKSAEQNTLRRLFALFTSPLQQKLASMGQHLFHGLEARSPQISGGDDEQWAAIEEEVSKKALEDFERGNQEVYEHHRQIKAAKDTLHLNE